MVSTLEEVVFLADTRGEVPVCTTMSSSPGGEWSVHFDLAVAGDVKLIGGPPKVVARSGLDFSTAASMWQATAIIDV